MTFQGIETDDVRVGGSADRETKEANVAAIDEAVPAEVQVATEEYQARTEETLINDLTGDGGAGL